MGDLFGYLHAAGLVAGPVIGLVLIVVGVLRVAGLPGLRQPAAGARSGLEHRTMRRLTAAAAAAGMACPWIVALAVKAWLDAAGRPTYPVSGFLEPTAVVVLLAATTTLWSWPLLLLAVWLRSRFAARFAPRHDPAGRLLLARWTFGAGLAAEAALFVPVFRAWDAMYIFVPLGLFLLPPMLAGYGAGLLVLRRRRPAAHP